MRSQDLEFLQYEGNAKPTKCAPIPCRACDWLHSLDPSWLRTEELICTLRVHDQVRLGGMWR